MKRIKRVAVVIIVVVLIVLFIYFCFHPVVYQSDYYSELGIWQSHLYSDVVQKKGEPLKVWQNDDGDWIVSYDGLDIRYGEQLKGIFECVTITGNQYRFGIWKIGIGTSRKKIESIYKHMNKLKDLPKDEFGVIEGYTWVWFEFDKDGNVSQIKITQGI